MNYNWNLYYLATDQNVETPLRIRYWEAKPNRNEDLDFYYRNGKMIFARLVITPEGKSIKKNKVTSKRFYFENQRVFNDINVYDTSTDYILDKEIEILKLIKD